MKSIVIINILALSLLTPLSAHALCESFSRSCLSPVRSHAKDPSELEKACGPLDPTCIRTNIINACTLNVSASICRSLDLKKLVDGNLQTLRGELARLEPTDTGHVADYCRLDYDAAQIERANHRSGWPSGDARSAYDEDYSLKSEMKCYLRLQTKLCSGDQKFKFPCQRLESQIKNLKPKKALFACFNAAKSENAKKTLEDCIAECENNYGKNFGSPEMIHNTCTNLGLHYSRATHMERGDRNRVRLLPEANRVFFPKDLFGAHSLSSAKALTEHQLALLECSNPTVSCNAEIDDTNGNEFYACFWMSNNCASSGLNRRTAQLGPHAGQLVYRCDDTTALLRHPGPPLEYLCQVRSRATLDNFHRLVPKPKKKP